MLICQHDEIAQPVQVEKFMEIDPTERQLLEKLFLVTVESENGQETHETLSFSRSPIVQLRFAANRYSRSSTKLFQENFGLTAMEWRLLVMLTRRPHIPVSIASTTIGVDKAAVSRSLAKLESAGLAIVSVPKGDPRRRTWALSQAGRELHTKMLAFSLKIHKHMFRGFEEEEIRLFSRLFDRFLGNLDGLENIK